MTITQRVNQRSKNPNLQLIGVYVIDGRQNAFLYDKSRNCIIQIYESDQSYTEDDLPELIDFEYDINQQGIKDLFDVILEGNK